MKKSYITWNRGQVADEVIIRDMKLLSKGRLKMTDGVKILEVRDLLPPVKRKPRENHKTNLMANNKINHTIRKKDTADINGHFYCPWRKALKGEITPQGAKNEALQVICATLLTPEKVTIKNIPDISDVNKLIALIGSLGVRVNRESASPANSKL